MMGSHHGQRNIMSVQRQSIQCVFLEISLQTSVVRQLLSLLNIQLKQKKPDNVNLLLYLYVYTYIYFYKDTF